MDKTVNWLKIATQKDARIAELEAAIADKDACIVELEEIMADKDARITELEANVEYYLEYFTLSIRRRFCGTSEKKNVIGQIGIFDNDDIVADVDSDTPEPEMEQITYTRRKRVGKRKDDLSKLPVEVMKHTLHEDECICPECGGGMHEMGHDSRSELTIIPAKVVVTVHERAVYSCRSCEKNNVIVPIIKAPMPQPVIKGSLASPSAVAHIMTQKYVMCAPLYRQEADWARQGVLLSRQTMSNWVIRCAMDWLLPLYIRLRALLLMYTVLHADETELQVLNEPGKAATSKSYMWLYRSSGDIDRHIVLFEYQPGRGQIYPNKFLAEFKGYLHVDGYAGYQNLPEGIILVGCWIHMRRRFADALKIIPDEAKSDSNAQKAIDKIGYIFYLERLWKSLSPEERYKLRLEKSKPLADKFFEWLKTLVVLPKSAMGRAVNYALEQKQKLMNVYLDGRVEFSNNKAENSIRPHALGRKNWLFCNTVDGAKASAMVYTMIESAKSNGIKPFEYLKYLFEMLPNTEVTDIDSFLPWGEAIPEYCRMPVEEGQDKTCEEKAG